MATQLLSVKRLLMCTSQLLLFLATVRVHICKGNAELGCSSLCTSCSTNGTCEQCSVGSYLGPVGETMDCLLCNKRCKSCIRKYSCLVCNKSYLLIGGYCRSCPKNCISCFNSFPCQRCKDGYFGRYCHYRCKQCSRCDQLNGTCLSESISTSTLKQPVANVDTDELPALTTAAGAHIRSTSKCTENGTINVIYVGVVAGVIFVAVVTLLLVVLFKRRGNSSSGTNRSTQTDDQGDSTTSEDYMDLTCRVVSPEGEHRYSVLDKSVTSVCAATPGTIPAIYDSAEPPYLSDNTDDTREHQTRAVTCVKIHTKVPGHAIYSNMRSDLVCNLHNAEMNH